MDFRVEVKETAIADLAEIVSYVAEDNPVAAGRFGDAPLDEALSLSQTPFKGSRYVKLAGIRKLTLAPYKIFYRVNEANGRVEVLRFWHSARNEPQLE
jgi:toxin ParE1/3/4